MYELWRRLPERCGEIFTFVDCNLMYSVFLHTQIMPPLEKLQFGRSFTDHMLTIDWNSKTGWSRPAIGPFENLSLSPAALVLHYGIEVRLCVMQRRHESICRFNV